MSRCSAGGLLLLPRMEVSLLFVRTALGTLKWILNLGHSYGRLKRLPVRLSKLKLDVIHYKTVKRQASDASMHLKTSRNDKTPMRENISVLCGFLLSPSFHSPPTKKRWLLCIFTATVWSSMELMLAYPLFTDYLLQRHPNTMSV